MNWVKEGKILWSLGSRTQGGADRSGRMSGHGWPRKPPRPPAERRHGCRSASRSTPPDSTIAKKSNRRPGPSDLVRPPWRPVQSPTTPESALDEVLAQCTDIVEYQLARAVEDQLGRAYNRTSHLSEHRNRSLRDNRCQVHKDVEYRHVASSPL